MVGGRTGSDLVGASTAEVGVGAGARAPVEALAQLEGEGGAGAHIARLSIAIAESAQRRSARWSSAASGEWLLGGVPLTERIGSDAAAECGVSDTRR